MKLEDYLATAPDDLRAAVNGRLDAMAGHGDTVDDTTPAALRRMSENLRADHRPPEHVWADLCERLAKAPPDVPSACAVVRQWGRTDDYAFLIPVTRLGPNAILAHFVTIRTFAHWLRESKGTVYPDKASARDALLDLVNTPDLRRHQVRLRDVLLHGQLVWATFHPPDGQQDPYACLPNQATTICACLALDRRTVGEDLLAFCYTLPAEVSPRFPTVMGAACSRSWSVYWRLARKGEPYGWTRPWPGYAGAHRCPEVVHRPIDGTALVSPVRRITP